MESSVDDNLHFRRCLIWAGDLPYWWIASCAWDSEDPGQESSEGTRCLASSRAPCCSLLAGNFWQGITLSKVVLVVGSFWIQQVLFESPVAVGNSCSCMLCSP